MLVPALAVLCAALVAQADVPQAAMYAQDLKRLSIEELANLEVTTVTKQPEQVLNTAAAIYVITGDDISRAGVTTVPDALRMAPGVIVSQSDANRWAVGVRGFADIFSKNVLVLIDGRSVYTPLVGGVHWAIQDLQLADIDRIEIIRGPGASVWGANAVNGVINIISRPAADTQGVRVTAAAGNVEHGRVVARYGGSAGSAAYRIYGKAYTRDSQYHNDDANFDDWRAAQGGFRVDWTRGARNTFTLSGDAYRTEVGERAEISLYSPPSIGSVTGPIDLAGGNLRAAWQHVFGDGSRLRLQSFVDRTDRDGFTFREARTTWDVDANVRFAPAGRHQLAAGVSGRISPSTVTQVVPTLSFLPLEHTYRVASAFVSDTVSLVPNRISAGAGLKAEYNSYTGTELLPSAHVLWTPAVGRRIWAAATRAVRTPSRFERDLRFQVLADPSLPFYVALEGSPQFDIETVVGTEAGYRELFGPDFYIDVTAFHNRYSGLAGLGEPEIGAQAAPIPHLRATFPFSNAVDGTSSGFEIAPDWMPVPKWRLSGAYSYLRIDVENRPGLTNRLFTENYAGTSPTHQVNLQSRIDVSRRLSVDQTYRYVTGLRLWDIPAYHAVDARVGWRFSRRADLAVVGQNLFDAHHAEFGENPVEIRRSLFAQLTLTR